ncbi:MAG: rod shape-determining protein MreD [Pseudomonadota bacterium]
MARLLPAEETLIALPVKMRLVPTLSVLVASALVTLPFDAAFPMLPPLGFMMLISWRMLRADIWPIWIGIPLGLFDDLVSGQPVGSAVALWTVAMLAMEAIDRRIVWRDFGIDWLLAATALFVYLLAGALLARAGDMMQILQLIFPQLAWSAMLLPPAMRVAAMLDGWRRRL